MQTDYLSKIMQNEDLLIATARAAGITIEEYKQKQLSLLREKEIEKLSEKFGFKVKDENSDKLDTIKYYRDVAEKIKNSGNKNFLKTVDNNAFKDAENGDEI